MHSVPIQPKFLSIIDGGANAFGAFGSLTTFNDGGQVHSVPIQPSKDGGANALEQMRIRPGSCLKPNHQWLLKIGCEQLSKKLTKPFYNMVRAKVLLVDWAVLSLRHLFRTIKRILLTLEIVARIFLETIIYRN